MNNWIVNEYKIKKIKLRVVTKANDPNFEKSLISFTGRITCSDDSGIIILDNDGVEHYIPFASIIEIRNLESGNASKEY